MRLFFKHMLAFMRDALRRVRGMGTTRYIQMITRDGGRTYDSWEVDRDGRQIGPITTSIHDSETISDGLSAIPARIPLFAESAAAGLIISALDRNRCCSLLRTGKRMQLCVTFRDWRLHPGQEQRVREVFARDAIAPVHDSRAEREAILHFPLPGSPQHMASLCAQVLATGYGVADDEPLNFTVIRHP